MFFDTFDCPWCGKINFVSNAPNSYAQRICDCCKKLVEITTDTSGRINCVKRFLDTITEPQIHHAYTCSDTLNDSPLISIGSVYGSVSFGGDVNVTNIYNETMKIINEAKNVSEEQKTQAKGILEYAKTYAPPFLPVIAEAIKKALGL